MSPVKNNKNYHTDKVNRGRFNNFDDSNEGLFDFGEQDFKKNPQKIKFQRKFNKQLPQSKVQNRNAKRDFSPAKYSNEMDSEQVPFYFCRCLGDKDTHSCIFYRLPTNCFFKGCQGITHRNSIIRAVNEEVIYPPKMFYEWPQLLIVSPMTGSTQITTISQTFLFIRKIILQMKRCPRIKAGINR